MKNRINLKIGIVFVILIVGLFLGGCGTSDPTCENGGDEEGSICSIAKQLPLVSQGMLDTVNARTEENCNSLLASNNYLYSYLDSFRPNEVFDSLTFNFNDQAAITNLASTLGSAITTAQTQMIEASSKNTITTSITITKYTVGDSGGVSSSTESVTVPVAYQNAIGYLQTAQTELNNLKATPPTRKNIKYLQDYTINIKEALLSFYGAVAGIQAETCKTTLDLEECPDTMECCPSGDSEYITKPCEGDTMTCCPDRTCKENCFGTTKPPMPDLNPTCILEKKSVGPTGNKHIVCQATTGTAGICTLVDGAGANDAGCSEAYATCEVTETPIVPGPIGPIPPIPPTPPEECPEGQIKCPDNVCREKCEEERPEECEEVTGLPKCPQDFETKYYGKTFTPTSLLDTRDKGFCDTFGDYPDDFDVDADTPLKVLDSGLKDEVCWLYVEAQDSSGGYKPEFYVKLSQVSKYFNDDNDTQTPTPKNLHVKEKDATSITLEWDAMTVQEADFFMVFRDNANKINVTTNTYKDTGLTENTNYTYFVKAYSNRYDIKESLASNSVTDSPGGACEIISVVVTPQCTTCKAGDTLKITYQTKGNCPSELFMEIAANSSMCIFPGK